MESNLVIRPVNGIGNRLNVIFSSMVIANATNRKLLVYWGYSPEFDESKFDELFQTDLNINFISESEWYKLRCNSVQIDKEVKFTKMIKRGLFEFDPDYNKNFKISDLIDSLFYKRKRNYSFEGFRYLWAYFDPDKPEDNVLWTLLWKRDIVDIGSFCEKIKPAEGIDLIIEDTLKSYDSNVYGIHIRRGDTLDHDWGKNYHGVSTDKLFEKKIQEIIDEKPDAKFYLSTDEKETLEKFISKFGDRIIYLKKEFVTSRAATYKGGQIDAAAEMFLLSKTKKIFGTNWSTFGETASRFTGIPYEVVK